MESDLHKKLKTLLAADGVTEYPITGNRRIDSVNDDLAAEVELSGNIGDAVARLKDIDRSIKVIVVPKDDAKVAFIEMNIQEVKGYILDTDLNILYESN